MIKNILPQNVINKFYHLPKAVLANIAYGFPAKKLKVIGVTGTDGKTTTTNMIYRILEAAGKKVSMVSTINAVVGGKSYDTGFHVTSPDPLILQKFAKQSLDNGDEYLILEITSHALDQYRSLGIKFDIGVITNITHEHLDYHKTYENYFNTKVKLIRNARFAVVNQNLRQKIQTVLGELFKGKLITFGLDEGDFNQKDVNLKLKIPGGYNIENALSALVVAFTLGINRKIAQRALEDFKGITGRMEEVENKLGIKIIVDFAHTPNALENALKVLRKQTKGKLIAVFGSAGKRDIEKRGLMGEIAAKLADAVIVAAEDPRGELQVINKQIVEGAIKAKGQLGENIFVIEDRAQAIDFAINKLATKGDIIGIFGKGHEKSMNLDGKKEIIWSDVNTVKGILARS